MRTSPNGLVCALVSTLLLAGGLGSCSSSRRTDLDASPDVVTEGGPLDFTDTDTTGTTCQGIRICIAAGQSLDVCLSRGTASAQDTFNQLLTCLKQQPAPGCTGSDPSCTCPEECYADGLCLDETSACLDSSGATSDGVCDQYCGG